MPNHTSTSMRAEQRPVHLEYLALALMYVAQGIPIGLAYYALGTLIRQSGHGVAAVGWTGLAFAPWAFKFLWAGAIDNLCRRKGMGYVIWRTQAAIVLTCVALSSFSPSQSLATTIALIVVLNTLSATQDIVTNGFAVIRMQGRRAGLANGIQVAGFIVGMLVGGGGLLMVYSRLDWQNTLLLLAAALALLYLPLACSRHWRIVSAESRQTRAAPPIRLRDLLQHRDLVWAILLALLFKVAGTAVATLVQPWLVDRGLSLEQIGQLQIANLCFVAAGGVVLGVSLIRRFGTRYAVLGSMALVCLSLGAAWMLERRGAVPLSVYYLAFGVQSFFEGAMFVTVWALLMNWSSADRPGTDFTAMQCCESLSSVVAAGLVAGLGQMIGYARVFGYVWIASGLILVIVAWILPRISIRGAKKD